MSTLLFYRAHRKGDLQSPSPARCDELEPQQEASSTSPFLQPHRPPPTSSFDSLPYYFIASKHSLSLSATSGSWMSLPKASSPSRSSSPVGPPSSSASLHHSPSISSLKSLGGPSKLREQLLVAPARSTSPKISEVEAEREPKENADGGGGVVGGGGAGWTGKGAGGVGWKSRGSEKGESYRLKMIE